jgi:hypothetical protein
MENIGQLQRKQQQPIVIYLNYIDMQ